MVVEMGRKKKVNRKIDELSDKYKKFALNYIRLQNGTKAYLQVYPNADYNVASVSAYHLLRKPKIKEAIREYMDGIFKEKEAEISAIFNKLVSITNVDIADFIDDNGNVKFKDFQEMNTYAIAEYSKVVSDTAQGRNEKQTIKLLDKQKALSELIKILGMITDKAEVSGTIIVKRAVRPSEKEDKPKRKYTKKKKEPEETEVDEIEIEGLNVQTAQRPEETE